MSRMYFHSCFVVLLLLIGIIFYPSFVFGAIQFEEVTESAGLDYLGRTYGASWGDLNGDGFVDLWTGNHGSFGKPHLYLNNGNGTFSDIRHNFDINTLSNIDIHIGSWADFDNDGDQDLIISSGANRGNEARPNFFLINNEGNLVDKSKEYSLDYPLGRGRMPLWFDLNNDGFLDVLLTNAPRTDGQAPTAIFLQTDKKFEDVTSLTDLKTEKAHYPQYSDVLNQDGKMDFIFFQREIEGIYEIKNLNFENKLSSYTFPKIKPWGLTIGDFNGDLLQDMFISPKGSGFFPLTNDILLINSIDGFFEKKFSLSDNQTSCIDAVSADFDNDMDLDIFLVCSVWGYEKTYFWFFDWIFWDKNYPNLYYDNQNNENFISVQNAGGAEGSNIGAGESVAIADFDNDGFVDLFVTNGGGYKPPNAKGGPNQLFKNLGNDNHWIEIDLIGTVSNRDGIGARLVVTTGDTKQLREQNGGMHYHSQNDQRIHVGLGENQIIDNILVEWPSGIINEINNVPVDQIIQLTENPSQNISNSTLKN